MSEDRESFYQWDLETQLLSMLDCYRDERREYWEKRLGEEEWSRTLEMQRSADELAERIMNYVALMAAPGAGDSLQEFNQFLEEHRQRLFQSLEEDLGSLSPQERRKISPNLHDLLCDAQEFEPDSPLQLVWERVCIDLAEEAIGIHVARGAGRLLQLSLLLTDCAAHPDTVKFLKHVSRCYIWGFDPECAILCRGAIETAFKDAVPYEVCERYRSPGPHGFGLEDKIEAALAHKLIDRETFKAAIRVKDRGDSSVHKDPELCKNAYETIVDSLNVIRRLAVLPEVP